MHHIVDGPNGVVKPSALSLTELSCEEDSLKYSKHLVDLTPEWAWEWTEAQKQVYGSLFKDEREWDRLAPLCLKETCSCAL